MSARFRSREEQAEEQRFDQMVEEKWSGDWLDYYGQNVDFKEVNKQLEGLRLRGKETGGHALPETGLPDIKKLFDEQIEARASKPREVLRAPEWQEQEPSRRDRSDETHLRNDESAVSELAKPQTGIDYSVTRDPKVLNRFAKQKKLQSDEIVAPDHPR
jgi:hypothetical protein